MRFTLVVSDKRYPISFLNNFTFYKWCVIKVAHCNVAEIISGRYFQLCFRLAMDAYIEMIPLYAGDNSHG